MVVVRLVLGRGAGVLHFPMAVAGHQYLELHVLSMTSGWIGHVYMLRMLHEVGMKQPEPNS